MEKRAVRLVLLMLIGCFLIGLGKYGSYPVAGGWMMSLKPSLDTDNQTIFTSARLVETTEKVDGVHSAYVLVVPENSISPLSKENLDSLIHDNTRGQKQKVDNQNVIFVGLNLHRYVNTLNDRERVQMAVRTSLRDDLVLNDATVLVTYEPDLVDHIQKISSNLTEGKPLADYRWQLCRMRARLDVITI
ncbi:hypothetical protein [Syntrophomonas erecta]